MYCIINVSSNISFKIAFYSSKCLNTQCNKMKRFAQSTRMNVNIKHKPARNIRRRVCMAIAAYPPGLFQSQAFFFWLRPRISSSLSSRTHHREVREAYRQSVDELRAAQKSTTFQSPCKSTCKRADPLSKPHPQNLTSGKSTPGWYAAHAAWLYSRARVKYLGRNLFS